MENLSNAETHTLELEENLSFKVALPLLEQIRESSDHPLELIAKNVTHIDMHCAQILLSAKQEWEVLKQPFKVTACSPQFKESLSILGMDDLLVSELGMD